MSYKYMRIQGREDSYITRYPKGIFSLCWNLVNAGVMDESKKRCLCVLMTGLRVTYQSLNHV